MVNVGRPSGGCQTCKIRRIKCDQKQPECLRCTSTGRKCPGVPKDADLLFKNETNAVSTRARNAKKRKAAASQASNPTSDTSSSDSSLALVPTSARAVSTISSSPSDSETESTPSPPPFEPENVYRMLCGLEPCMEDIAISYYVRTFVEQPSQPDYLMSYLNTLSDLLIESSHTSALYNIVAAVAMSGLGNFRAYRYLKAEAPKMYVKALKQISLAFSDPIESKSDATLMSVMLMGLFEQMYASEDCIDAFRRHLEGAAILLRHRGPEQFKNRRSLLIFRTVRMQQIGMYAGLSKPLELFESDPFWLSDSEFQTNPINTLSVISANLPRIRYETDQMSKQPPSPDRSERLTTLVQEAKDLDRKFENWFHYLPKEFLWTSIPYLQKSMYEIDPEQVFIYPGMVHQYKGIFQASTMNQWRTMRVYTHRSIIKCLELLREELPSVQDSKYQENNDELEKSLYVLQRMADDICASVPYHLGYAESLEPAHPSLKSREQLSKEANAAYFLIWPLFLVARLEGAPIVQKMWARGRLMVLANFYGFQQAKILSRMGPPVADRKGNSAGKVMRAGDPNSY